MSSKAAREKWFVENSAVVVDFAKKHGLVVEKLNRGYQLRIGGVIDIYPVNKRWHYLKTGDRGHYEDISELDLAIFASPFGHLKVIETEPQDFILSNKPIKLKPGARWDLPKMSEGVTEIHPDTRAIIDMIERNDKYRHGVLPWYKRVWYKIVRRSK